MARVLIISGIPFRNDTNLGKTLCTLFADIKKDDLAQVYFSPMTPNVDRCQTYYRVDEKLLIKSLFGLIPYKCGKIINTVVDDKGKSVREAYKVASIKTNTSVILLRDLIWACSVWINSKLKKWLNSFSPEVVFFILSDTQRNYKLLKYVLRQFHVPVVVFVTDDYYHNPNDRSNTYISRRFKQLQREANSVKNNVSYVIGCSSLAAKEFGEIFNAPSETILTPVAPKFLKMELCSQTNNDEIVLRYFGNLGLGRWLILEQLGKALEALRLKGYKAHLEIFSNISDTEIINRLNIGSACFYKGWIQGEEFERMLHTANIAVHVESFDDKMCKRTRLSVSTKIADYLGAGKCILAIGKRELASIQHIQNVAYTISNLNDLEKKLESLLQSSETRYEMQRLAREKAYNEHDINVIPMRLKEILNGVKY